MIKIVPRLAVAIASAALTFAAIALAASLTPAHAETPVSGDISLVPRLQIMHLSTLPSAEASISADQAIDTVINRFRLSPSQIDPDAGAVLALVNVPEDPLKRNIKAWIVTADLRVIWSLEGHPILYHTFSVVVNAVTGRYEFGYLGSPGPAPKG